MPHRSRLSRRVVRRTALTGGVAASLALAGSMVTYASWSSATVSREFTVRSAAIPQTAAPRVTPGPRPRIAWTAVRLTAKVPVERYRVTRHLGAVAQVACEVPATARPVCEDRYAPPGYRATYTVAAVHGRHWIGPESPESAVVTAPGEAVPISIGGVVLVPGAAGDPVVVPGGLVASAAPPETGETEPDRDTGQLTGPEQTPPESPSPVVVPPAPPVEPETAPGDAPAEPQLESTGSAELSEPDSASS